MTPRGRTVRIVAVGRYLGALAGILVILYALVFFTGDSATPKLGLDLRGGTTVTLHGEDDRRQAADAGRLSTWPGRSSSSGSTASVSPRPRWSPQGTGPIVDLGAGRERGAGQSVGQTAQLRLRPVIFSAAAAPAAPSGSATPSASGSATPSGAATPSASGLAQGGGRLRLGEPAGLRPGADLGRRRTSTSPPAAPSGSAAVPSAPAQTADPTARSRPRRPPASTRSSTRRPSPTSRS